MFVHHVQGVRCAAWLAPTPTLSFDPERIAPSDDSESGVPAPRIDRAQHCRGLSVRAIVGKRDRVVAAHAAKLRRVPQNTA